MSNSLLSKASDAFGRVLNASKRKISSQKLSICAAMLAAFMGASAVAPAEAMPMPTKMVSTTTDVQQARVVVRLGYWRGHRGYRHYRHGYRFYRGFWYPAAAFGPVIVIHPGRHWYWCGRYHHRHRCWR
jgi:hypothetical protein